MENLVRQLRADYPKLQFKLGDTLAWSPSRGCVLFVNSDEPEAAYGLLHEVGHARLRHTGFSSDADLLQKEVAAWEYAKKISGTYNLIIPEEHIEQCLDSYRDWQYRRSTCPTCGQHGVQNSQQGYTCLNCLHTWGVSSSCLKRPYRRSTEPTVAK